MNALELIGGLAAHRIKTIVDAEPDGRIIYAIVDLSPEVTSTIGMAIHALNDPGIEVAIHEKLAVEAVPAEIRTADVAMRFRNFRPEGMRATIFSVPPEEVELAVQSLGDVERINGPWLLDPAHSKRWIERAHPGASVDTIEVLGTLIKNLLASDIVASETMLAEFVVAVAEGMKGSRGLAPLNAVNEALPTLRLPRGMLDTKGDPQAFARSAEMHFRRAMDATRKNFFLQTKSGDYQSTRDLQQRIAETIADDEVAKALTALVNDRNVRSGGWTDSQRALSNIHWERVRPFFEGKSKSAQLNLGQQTEQLLKGQFPDHELTAEEKETLHEIGSRHSQLSPKHEEFFVKHRERIRSDPRLYKKWERYVFDKPIECDDLLIGLVRLAYAANKDDSIDSPVLLIRLRDAEKASFWESDKNTELCRYLRDRYRGIGKLLGRNVVLRFGRLWEGWESDLTDKVEKSSRDSTEFHFEAHVVPGEMFADGRDPRPDELRGLSRAQLTWNPGGKSIANSFSSDLNRILPPNQELAFLLATNASQSRQGRSGVLQSIRLSQVETITDARNGSSGALANPDKVEFRVDETWPRTLDEHLAKRIITQADRDRLLTAFNDFRAAYTDAIRALISPKGDGIASPALIRQAELFGDLLGLLRQVARSEEAVVHLWEPILRIGTTLIEGDRPMMIVAPWHPLRLAEIAAKAQQAADIIGKVVTGTADKAVVIEDFVKDRVASLSVSYYADVGVVGDENRTIVVETSRHGDYSLLEPPYSDDPNQLADDPAEDAVREFGKIAEQYLALRPHERSNFSAALMDAESEELPVLMANHLAKQIEDQADLRCDLIVTHEDPIKLRRIYERQNRRIGHEIDSYLTSETARTFLSRLRVGIVSPQPVIQGTQIKTHDIVMLTDVIARTATVNWIDVTLPTTVPAIASHVPADFSRRRPHRMGAVTTAVYLTGPVQPLSSQRYLDAIHDIFLGKPSPTDSHFLPIQEVNFRSSTVSERLSRSHALGNWVIIYDRIADRRLVSSSENLRVLRYYSPPRSVHNVIVSTEISKQYVGERLRDDLSDILPGSTDESLETLTNAIHRKASSLSGGIIMRGAQWENGAKELIGIVCSQRQLDLLLSSRGTHHTAWFFLDEFKRWLDISGEISDVLAVSLMNGDGGPRVLLSIIEAKCVSETGLHAERTKSQRQLETTYAAMESRFLNADPEVDAPIWRGRLADMLLEHVDPFESVEGIDYDEWLEGIRKGSFPIDLEGHSIVFVHDMPTTLHREPNIPDMGREKAVRRKVAQWILGRDLIGGTLREYDNETGTLAIHIPQEWPTGGHVPSHQQDTTLLQEVMSEAPLSTTDPPGRRDALSEEMAAPTVPGDSLAEPTRSEGGTTNVLDTPSGWIRPVWETVRTMAERRSGSGDDGEEWLRDQVESLKSAFHTENMNAPVIEQRLTPNAGIVYLDGRSVTTAWIEKKQTDLLTRYGIEILRIMPMPGRIGIALKRPRRATLHLSEAWLRRKLETSSPEINFSPVIGEREEDGSLFYLPLAGPFLDQERAAPHTIISGNTGSGKGILATNLLLDLCAFNDPKHLALHLIDPKRGVDYGWTRGIPHFKEGIIDLKEDAISFFRNLVHEMEVRYERIRNAGVANIDQYRKSPNRLSDMPRIVVFFDEVANWMQDEDFKEEVEPLINEIATKSRAAGIHLVMIYQRADNLVMTMQLRTNLGNKLILRLGDEGSSRIALGDKGAERLLGKGHVIAKLDNDERIYGQVPFLDPDDVPALAAAIKEAWFPKAS